MADNYDLQQHFHVQIMPVFRSVSLRRRKRIMETIQMLERKCERVLPYGKEKIDERLSQKYERKVKPKTDVPYLVRDRITIIVDEIARAIVASVREAQQSAMIPSWWSLLSRAGYKYIGTCAGCSSTMQWRCSGYRCVANVCEIQINDGRFNSVHVRCWFKKMVHQRAGYTW